MHTCTHAHMHTCTHAHMHTCTHAHMHTCTHAHMHTCTHAHMHTYTHTHIHTCTHAHMHTCTHAHMHTCTHAHMHTCTHAHIHIHPSIHPYIHPSIHTYIHLSLYMYMSICLLYIYIYMHIWYMYMYIILNWYKSTHVVILRLLVSQFQTSIDMVLAQGQKVKGIDLLDQQYVTTDEEPWGDNYIKWPYTYPHKIWPYMVLYLHFRILKFPLIICPNSSTCPKWSDFRQPTRWLPVRPGHHYGRCAGGSLFGRWPAAALSLFHRRSPLKIGGSGMEKMRSWKMDEPRGLLANICGLCQLLYDVLWCFMILRVMRCSGEFLFWCLGTWVVELSLSVD